VFYVTIRWFTGRTAAAPVPDVNNVVAASLKSSDGSLLAKQSVMTGSQAEMK
jgi:hypothetical protein